PLPPWRPRPSRSRGTPIGGGRGAGTRWRHEGRCIRPTRTWSRLLRAIRFPRALVDSDGSYSTAWRIAPSTGSVPSAEMIRIYASSVAMVFGSSVEPDVGDAFQSRSTEHFLW